MDSVAREALAERILSFARECAAEVLVSDIDFGLTRFTHNAIHQNVANTDTSVRVRTIVDGRTGVAATNALDDSSLRDAVARALAMGALAPADHDAPGLVENVAIPTPEAAFDEATASASPTERALVVADITRVAEDRGLWAAGYVTNERSGITIVNSAGTRVSYDGTSCGLNVKANGPDSTDSPNATRRDSPISTVLRPERSRSTKRLRRRRRSQSNPGTGRSSSSPPRSAN